MEREFNFSTEIIKNLLIDRTTGKNILWATEDYYPISEKSQILLSQITGENANRIKPRAQKCADTQVSRTRNKAEVFTPSWICNEQNNLIDEKWISKDRELLNGKNWQDYVKLTRLEITCGEAPYLVSRYDSVSGESIEIDKRIGILDRKMRFICKNIQNEAEYFSWVKIAFQNCYGFELQGDNLFLARKNMLLSFVEYTQHFLKRKATDKEILEITEIISWNLWQMDGLTFCTPFSSEEATMGQDLLFAEMNNAESYPCKIMDWKDGKAILYKSLLNKNRRK